MATHYPDHKNMTVKEAIEKYRYMQPGAIICDGARKSLNDSLNDILKYAVVSSGFVYYYTTDKNQEAKQC